MAFEESLKSRWDCLTSSLDSESRNKWWEKINSHYSESGRFYHTLQHIFKMFLHFDEYQEKLENKDAVAYAIFFHDLHYNPQSSDNEEDSIKMFRDFAKDCKIPEDSPVHSKVESLIILTKTHLTEEHKLEGSHGYSDEHYFLDFDMAILGSSPDEYKEYADKIRQEYKFLPERMYKDLRAKVLKSFLQIPNIFTTEEFHGKFESQARENIQQEITTLVG